jgi:uncharacterized protein YecE (DUF72 family)
MAQIRIGCSGWLYRHWRGDFYPAGLRQKDEFAYYAERFDTAEINASFYRLPSEATVARWREQAPPGFLYAWKASRYLTHNKKLKEPEDSLALILGRMAPLGPAHGPVLYQLPPMLRLDYDRLAYFLDRLPSDRRHTIEFRHPSWYAARIFDLLAGHDVALCLSDHHHAPTPWEATAGWIYVRGHGPDGRYAGRYRQEQLANWAARIEGWASEGRDVFCYFDNDIGGAAPRDALDLKAMLHGPSGLGAGVAAVS